MQQEHSSKSEPSRRDFVKGAAATTAAVAAATTMAIPRGVYAQGTDVIKVGLVGCGGRGSGAAQNAMNGDPGVKIVAMGDMFEDKLAKSHQALTADPEVAKRVDVPKDRQFVGWDAYKGVIAASDVVILATPPHFRPLHLQAVLEGNKHCFCEKPVATDPVHLRMMMKTSEQFGKNGKSLVSGLCYRYDAPKVELMKKIHDENAIGDIRNIEVNYLTGGLWSNKRQDAWSDMEFQLRNWLYFTWLSGDMIVEQHIHSLDKMMWTKKDVPPAYCYSSGGRTVRTERPQYGNVFDHFCTTYVWEDGTKGFAHARQWAGEKHLCFAEVSDFVYGTDGVAALQSHVITGKNPWKGKTNKHSSVMYDAEHVALMKSIRDGKPINNGSYMCTSTLVAIMGRMAAYTGEKITWEQAMNSKEDLAPKAYAFGPIPLPDVAVPGTNEYV